LPASCPARRGAVVRSYLCNMKMTENTEAEPAHGSPGRKKRILIVDDHAVVRQGLVALIGGEKDMVVCGEADHGQKGLGEMRRLNPDAVLLDISLPGSDGIELLKAMLAEHPKLPIMVLSMHSESLYAIRALRAGARGYVMKTEPIEEVLVALRKILAGETYINPRFSERLIFNAIQSHDGKMTDSPVDQLSDRELEVLQHIGKGCGTREVAEELHLSIKTVETHRAHIKEKLGLKDAAEVARFAVEWGAAKAT
jgi:DNA-binding NarL/FixJ family response regulator